MHSVFSVANFIADDSHFQCAESFVSDTLPLRSLNMALRLGKLGEQTVVISQRGFERLKFVDIYSVDKNVCYPKFLDRDTKARDTYRKESTTLIRRSHEHFTSYPEFLVAISKTCLKTL